MAISPSLPSWPEFAKGYAQMHLDSERMLAEAIASGDKVGASLLRKSVRASQKQMDKYRITIRR